METITVKVYRDDVYREVAKATDYTGSKLIGNDSGARERILALDDDLTELGRFWDEAVLSVNENFKEMLISGDTLPKGIAGNIEVDTPPEGEDVEIDDSYLINIHYRYEGVLEVSRSFDKSLTGSVESTLRSFFIASIIGQWFKFANKGEAQDYFAQAAELLETAERLLYSRRRPALPTFPAGK